MKSPLWIITSLFAIILVALFAFILYSMKSLFIAPKAAAIKVTAIPEVGKKEEAAPRDVSVIYEEHDLFGTYRPAIIPIKSLETLPAIPTPPARIPVRSKPKQAIQFLKPLPLKISGIIGSNNEMKSQVSFVNTNTGKTESFKVGDKVLDAYILRILPKKVLVVRSNGQQETIYVYSNEAKEDTTILQDTSWSEVLQQQSEHSFLINPTEFKSRVNSLADLIEMLDLTTVSRAGKPAGVRIGKMKKTSIGFAGGFEPGDIITKILSTAPVSSAERMALFNEIASLELGAQIPVQYMRHNTLNVNTYTLFNIADPTARLDTEDDGTQRRAPSPSQPVAAKKPVAQNDVPKNGPSVAQVAPVLPQAPTTPARNDIKDIKKRDLDAMKRYGGRPENMPSPSLSAGANS